MTTNKALEVHNITKFKLHSNYGKDLSLLGEGAFSHVLIFQSIYDHSVRATFEMFDSGIRQEEKKTKSIEETESFNLTAGEKVELVIEDERKQKLEFIEGRVFTISEVKTSMTNTMKENFKIEMCLNDYIKNELEENFVVKRFDQKISATANEVLSTITERPVFVDSTVTELPIKGCTERPFDFVTTLCPKAQPEKFPTSAGYLLFDTYNGLNFRSIDVMFSQEPKRRMILNETPRLPPGYSNKILNVEFSNTMNVLDSLRYGALQNDKMRTLDPNYHTYAQNNHNSDSLYLGDNNLKDVKPVVGDHLQLPTKSSRVINQIRNTGVHPPGEDLDAQLPFAQEPTFDHDTIPQLAIKRYYQSRLYTVNIKLYGDFGIFPGDVVYCDFPEISAEQTSKKISKKKSGKYLVADVAHLICPEGCYTKLNMIRDSIVEEE
jgi:hypothetical protein